MTLQNYYLEHIVHENGVIELYIRMYTGRWWNIAFANREYFHEFARVVLGIDKQINPDLYTEEIWSKSLQKDISDILR